VLRGQRKLTPDRVENFARLMCLNAQERNYFARWVALRDEQPKVMTEPTRALRKRKEKQNGLLSSWVNVYVKDCSRLKGFRPDPDVIYRLLGGIVSKSQIARSLTFLFREGYLRRTIEGKIVENDVLSTTTDGDFDRKKEAFHRKTLEIARNGISFYPWERRRESALVLPLNPDSAEKLKDLLKEFYERLLVFAEEHPHDNEELYQVLINLSPIGGRSQNETVN
jgi:uncharacterized protein (TIGR02147 family)